MLAMHGLAKYREELLKAIATVDLDRVEAAIRVLAEARDNGRWIFLCGNGGSAMSVSHLATDLIKGASYGRFKRFRVMSLNESVSTLTAYSNDVGYESVFVEQLKNFAEPDDVLIAASSSGNSPNVLRAVEYGNFIGCHTIGLTGFDGGKLGPMAHTHIHVEHGHTGQVEDAHLMILHMIGYQLMDASSDREQLEHAAAAAAR
jgi:D-sedoheptulose 7-phosphate isomerase